MTNFVEKIAAVKGEIGKVIAGYDHIVNRVLICMLTDGGHVLFRAVPGTAKTTLAKTLKSTVADSVYARYQMTPDMKPTDVLGVEIFNQKTGEYKIKKGPIVGANFTLLDEINRTTPKTLSATLQPMQEGTVTIGDTTFEMPEFAFVLATMNPVEQEGTFPLPEATLDRFAMLLDMRYVSRADEMKMLRNIAAHGRGAQNAVAPVITIPEILQMREMVKDIAARASDRVLAYIVDLARATRPEDESFNNVHAQPHPDEARILRARGEEPLTQEMLREMIVLGGSPRTEIWTLHCAAAHAFVRGANNIEPDDVKAVFRDVARGRIVMSPVAVHDGYTSDKVIDAVLARVHVIQ